MSRNLRCLILGPEDIGDRGLEDFAIANAISRGYFPARVINEPPGNTAPMRKNIRRQCLRRELISFWNGGIGAIPAAAARSVAASNVARKVFACERILARIQES